MAWKYGYITGEVRTENGETITRAYAYDPLGELISFTQFYDSAHISSEDVTMAILARLENKFQYYESYDNHKQSLTYK